MNRKSVGEEIRRRVPRIAVSAATAFIFWITIPIAAPLVKDITVPGINVSASWLVQAAATLIGVIFLVRALSDALVLADIGTDLVMKRLGVKEERPLKRAARDVIYMILVVLLASGAKPFLAAVPEIGGLLSPLISLIALGVLILLIYDFGRILYGVLEERAEVFADWLAELAERVRERKRM